MRSLPQKIRSGLVELRTNSDLLYVSPSFSQRLYLLWTFRNFHRLPLQVLNSHQQDLIEKLCRTAVVAKEGALARAALIGSVENLNAAWASRSAEAKTTPSVVKVSTCVGELPKAVGSGAVPEHQIDRLGSPTRLISFAAKRAEELVSSRPAAQTGSQKKRIRISIPQVLGRRETIKLLRTAISCAGILALSGTLFHLYEKRAATRKSAPQQVAIDARTFPSLPAATGDSAAFAKSPKLIPSSTPNVEVQPASLQAPLGAPANPRKKAAVHVAPSDAGALADAVPLPYTAEWPKSGFEYPIAPDPAIQGAVTLNAVIAADGSVTTLHAIRGNRLLVRAAIDAVRHWRYAPYKVDGNSVAAQTTIVINFHGEDAVSVAFLSGNDLR